MKEQGNDSEHKITHFRTENYSSMQYNTWFICQQSKKGLKQIGVFR